MSQSSGSTTIVTPRGLAGVIVDDTAISCVDGSNGELSYRGHSIDSLVERPFTTVANLVSRSQLDDSLDAALIEARNLSERETEFVLGSPAHVHPMQVLQSTVPVLDRSSAFDSLDNITVDARQGFVIAAKLPAIIATLYRQRPCQISGDYITGFLDAIGSGSSDTLNHALNTTQILQLEHSFNASTFVARSVASTLAPIENCLAAAFGSLHGVLHGGADQAALETADRVGDPSQAAAFVDDCIANNIKVMGMGHREYRVTDPRARYIKRIAEEVTRGTEHEQTFATLAAIEERFTEVMQQRGKSLHANLEFYKGVVYRVIGLPPQYFTAVFAMSRVFGYVAHFMESRVDNRIMRPTAKYVGPAVAR